MKIIEAIDLKVRFRRGVRRRYINAVDGVTLDVDEGDIFGLLGPNGAGKSSAMHSFLGLLQPDGGEVRVFGQRPHPGTHLFDDIVYLPEEPHYHPYLTVLEAVRYYARLHLRPIPDTAIRDALDRLGLGEFPDLRLSKCSKGMKQKVGLAACMLFTPRILFLDEPTRGLDPMTVRDFRDYLLDINSRGTTIVLNSHVLAEVETICNRVAIMNRGKVLALDRLSNLARFKDDQYEVLLNATGEPWPEFMAETRATAAGTVAQVRAQDLEALIRHCRERGIRLDSCRLQRETLEDVFMRVIREGAAS